MALQKTDWGEISWLEDDDVFSIRGLKAGIVTLACHAHQPKHRHYEEQVIYVMEGQAISILDGVESRLSAGDFFHWPAGVNHEIFNTGDGPLRHLLISNPDAESGLDNDPYLEEAVHMPVSSDLIYIAAEAIRTQFLESLHYGYVIFDALGNVVLQSQFYPEYCVSCCQPGQNPGKCSCMRHIPLSRCTSEHVFQCEKGINVFQYPVMFHGVLLGYIQGGYIRYSSSQGGQIENVYDSPASVVVGIRALLRRIVKAIRNFCEFEQFRKELTEKEFRISSQEERQQILLKDLRDAQFIAADLKINHHFLFNTLNSMASMALNEGSMPLYQSIVDLSKMFHYTLRTQTAMVPLEKEVDYVKAYLQLQKLRYEDGLRLSFHLDKNALPVLVPFNFLQPVIENAFQHGFDDSVQKELGISIQRLPQNVEICISNSGKKLTEQALRNINQSVRSNTSHGLSMLYQKLSAVYGDTFFFEIGTDQTGNTSFVIRIPLEGGAT